jgi:hypothetical protein
MIILPIIPASFLGTRHRRALLTEMSAVLETITSSEPESYRGGAICFGMAQFLTRNPAAAVGTRIATSASVRRSPPPYRRSMRARPISTANCAASSPTASPEFPETGRQVGQVGQPADIIAEIFRRGRTGVLPWGRAAVLRIVPGSDALLTKSLAILRVDGTFREFGFF